jgi:flagellar basal body-associated protein FliL
MKNPIHKSLLLSIRDLHIKILQSNNLPEIGNYLQEILDHVMPALSDQDKKIISGESGKARIIRIMKSDIKSILDGTYSRAEIAKYKATLDIAWIKRFFTETLSH